jgi:hypothetical protein
MLWMILAVPFGILALIVFLRMMWFCWLLIRATVYDIDQDGNVLGNAKTRRDAQEAAFISIFKSCVAATVAGYIALKLAGVT